MNIKQIDRRIKNKLKKTFSFARNIKPPGFRDASLYDVGALFYRGITKGAIANRASSLSFSFFLALFPAILFLFTLISYIPLAHFQDQLLDIIQKIVPERAYAATRATIEDIVRQRRGDLLSFGFLTTIYFSTNGINAMIEGFNRTYHTVRTRSFLKQRLVALLLTLILSTLLLISVFLMVLSQNMLLLLVKWKIVQFKVIYFVLLSGKWLIISIMFFLSISCLYFFGTGRKGRSSFVSPGAIVATISSGIISLGFSYFVNHFGHYNKIYGSIGTLIVILLWIYFNAIAILIGFELNASIGNTEKHHQPKVSEPLNRHNTYKQTISS